MKVLNDFKHQVQLAGQSTLMVSLFNAVFTVFAVTYVFLMAYPYFIALEAHQRADFFTLAPLSSWPFVFSLSYILLLFFVYNFLSYYSLYWMIRDAIQPRIKKPSLITWVNAIIRFTRGMQGYAMVTDPLFCIACLEHCSLGAANKHLREYAPKALAAGLPAVPQSMLLSASGAAFMIVSLLVGVLVSILIPGHWPVQTLLSYHGMIYSWLPSLVLFDIAFVCVLTAKSIERKLNMTAFVQAYSTIFKDRLDSKPNVMS